MKNVYYRGYRLEQTTDKHGNTFCNVYFRLRHMCRWIWSEAVETIEEAKQNIDNHLGV